MTSFLKTLLGLAFLAIALIFPQGPLSALGATATNISSLDLVVGDIQTVPAKNLTRVSVTNPDVADISDAQENKVSLLAKSSGETLLFLWDAAGKHTINVRVVREDLNIVKEHIQKLLDESGITGISLQINDDEGKVVIIGDLSKDDKARLDKIISRYSDAVLNFVKEEKNESLIQIDMEIVEISTSLEKNLGIVWGAGGSGTSSSNSATGSSTAGGNSTGGSTGVSLNYGENKPGGKEFRDLFKIGSFARSSSLNVTVNALIEEGKARLISKPRLVVISGKQATFLVGGEIPISNTTSNSTGTTQTTSTSYSQYGVNLSVSPTIRQGKIDIILNVDIRDIDASNSSNGSVAFITRTASTDVYMDNKQTVVLAGLIKYSGSLQVNKVPFLSNIPIIGNLFTNRAMPSPDTKTEMVIILTPIVLNDKNFVDTQLVMPTKVEREAWQDMDSRYEHTSLNPAPAVVAKPAPQPAVVITPAPVAAPKAAPKVEAPKAAVPPKASAPAEAPKKLEQAPPVVAKQAAVVPAAKPVATVAPLKPPEVPAKPSEAPVAVALASMAENRAYARAVQEKISTKIGYPQQAIENSWTGTVKLELKIRRDGALASVNIVQSSGHSVFDESALRAAQGAAPYAPFTAGMKQDELTITLPIVYSRR